MPWAPDYVTLSEAKNYLRVGDTSDDVEIALAITAASRAIDRHTNRQFGVVAAVQERTFTACFDRRINRWVVEVEIEDLQTQTGLIVEFDGVATTEFTLNPINAAQDGRPWTLLVVNDDAAVKPTRERDKVTITALWGWTAVPDPVKQATLLQASRFHARRFAPFGIAGSPDVGSELRLLAKLDVDVATSLSDFVRWWAAA